MLTDNIYLPYIGFIICAIIIFVCGKKLTFYGDLLAEKTGLGKAWFGLVIMASVTSLPELMVGLSASAFVGSADLAVSDVLGSCAFNLGIFALMDALIPNQKSILSVASPGHTLAASFGIILLALVGAALYLPNDIILTSWIGITSMIFIFVYFLSVRLMFVHEKMESVNIEKHADKGQKSELSMRNILLRYVFNAFVIIICALILPYFAEAIAINTGIGESFVGSFFLAASTSLPEVAVAVTAVRSGLIDMAVGNLLGSNIFNVFIIALSDLIYTKGHILKDASEINIVSVFSTIIMSAIVIIGLSFRNVRKSYVLAWDAVLIFIVYLINMYLLF